MSWFPVPVTHSSPLPDPHALCFAARTPPPCAMVAADSPNPRHILTRRPCGNSGNRFVWRRHLYLVSTAQTTIEFYKHMAERASARRRGEVWRGNPHDQGVVRNWKVFLGVNSTNDLGKILLPSSHGPVGDGLHWEHLKQGAAHPVLKTAIV